MAGTAIGFSQSHVAVLGGADGSLWGKEDDLRDDHPGFPKKTFLYHTITNTGLRLERALPTMLQLYLLSGIIP